MPYSSGKSESSFTEFNRKQKLWCQIAQEKEIFEMIGMIGIYLVWISFNHTKFVSQTYVYDIV